MSYSHQDRFGNLTTTYAFNRGSGALYNAGAGTTGTAWWPGFASDFSKQERGHPGDSLFERHVEPIARSNKDRKSSKEIVIAKQLRNPASSIEAETDVLIESKMAGHELTERQGFLQREERQRRSADAWHSSQHPSRRPGSSWASFAVASGLEEMAAGDLKSRQRRNASEPVLNEVGAQVEDVSREMLEKQNVLVRRGQNRAADGYSGAQARRHNPLSMSSMMFAGDSHRSDSLRRSSRRRQGLRAERPRPATTWNPENFLPVPRGGWNSQAPTRWPTVEPSGSREFANTGPKALRATYGSLLRPGSSP